MACSEVLAQKVVAMAAEAPGGPLEPELMRKSSLQSGFRRLLGSQLSNLEAAVAIGTGAREKDSAQQHEQARCAARAEVLRILRSHPGIYKALGLQSYGKETTDKELLMAFSLLDTPGKVLRTTGFNPREVATILQKLPVACQEPLPPKPKTQEEQNLEEMQERGLWFLVVLSMCAFVMVVAGVALGVSAVAYFVKQESWFYGNCELTMFSAGHGSCNAKRCEFDVSVWEEGKSRSEYPKKMHNWRFPLLDVDNPDELSVDGAPFRCCNLERGFQCCKWFDKKYEAYCDNWSFRYDANGVQCPKGFWPCRFKTTTGTLESNVTRLELAKPTAVWDLGGPAISVSAIGFILAGCLMRRGVQHTVRHAGARIRSLCADDARRRQIRELEAQRFQDLDPTLQKEAMRRERNHRGSPRRGSLQSAPPQPPSRLHLVQPVSEGPLTLNSPSLSENDSPSELPSGNSSVKSAAKQRQQRHRGGFSSPASALREVAQAGPPGRGSVARRPSQASVDHIQDLEVVDYEEGQHLPHEFVPTQTLAEIAAHATDHLRPIVTPLPGRRQRAPRRGKDYRDPRAPPGHLPGHRKHGWPASQKDGVSVIDL